MNPALFREAADRIGLRAKIVKKPSVADIDAALYPVVLMLADGTALIAEARGEGGAEVYAPDTATHETLPDDALAGRYAGYAIYVRPRAEFLEPGASDPADFSRHWFWGSVAENKSVYLSVLGAAVLINLFGLVSPLFVMNVYDRVIPNNAVETGWVLGIGALTVFVFDFIMRTLRGYFIDFASRKSDVVSSRRIYDHLLNMRLAERPASSGSFANMLREFESVRDFMTSATITGFVDLPFTCFYLLVIFLIGGPVAILLFALIAAVLVAGILLQMPLKSRIGRSNHAAQAKHGLLVETIYGLETIKASGGEGRMRARYETQVGESAAAGCGRRRRPPGKGTIP